MALNPDQLSELQQLLEDIEPETKHLSERERSFVEDTTDRMEKWGSNLRFSPKQWDWLRRIHAEIMT